MQMPEIAFEHFDPEYELGNLDSNGKPIKPRKKPGRKPNPPSPAQRKAQNRAAQRAFRERKRREMKEAEMNIKKSLYMRDQALKDVKRLQSKVDELIYENNYLKGQLLTLKIACMAHRVDVPKYWDTGFRDKMGSDITTFSQSKHIPQSLEFFLNNQGCIVNVENEDFSCYTAPINSSLSSTASTSSSTTNASPDNINTTSLIASTLSSFRLDEALDPTLMQYLMQPDIVSGFMSQIKDAPPEDWFNQLPSEITNLIPPDIRTLLNNNNNDDLDLSSLVGNLIDTLKPPTESDFWAATDGSAMDDKIYIPGPLQPLDAVAKMRAIKDQNGEEYLLSPTELQRHVPHDPRIDLIPGPMMRDYMILFQDFFDLNELFNYLIDHAFFMGGELGNPDCWFVPPTFISKYWFLCPNYRPSRPDNAVEMAVIFANKMLDRLNRRKEMYIMRDKYMDEFPPPTLFDQKNDSDTSSSTATDDLPDLQSEHTEDFVHCGSPIDVLVYKHINNKEFPRLVSPNVFTV
ncbi:hypothetical protein BCV72DRAFT_307557 [Rhizopus microsporus var. microsporus]|uniref:BZIP domain-containing protein n=2 Tax=Rhizopus microsporus TaxID=58291 RepID=A0A2G4SN62_RHIZD|nr:uncharacterized protein RHIMIDRAFT_239678 [Rhizopus microsporus ATCC 52813]ORE04214.1 hypothetical protein BCV72DRAFT_307557 [Rhizopus microsporus var. microsporus]PHZ10200.1 hypothetical protein RHIMIDRAFT_239678 [Rhizopus microsporus ATCC 52813]